MNKTEVLNSDLAMSDKERDISISIIRMISTLLIIICHFFQYLNYEIAWWLNVGVQIFLFMSGYLYAKRSFTNNDLSFIKKQFIKILVDYYIVAVPIIALYFLFLPNEISFSKAVYFLLTYDNLGGGSIHLWYIPYCLLCYLITPLLSRVFDELFAENHLIIKFFAIMMLVFLVSWTFLGYFNSAWVSCYILGFFISRLEARDEKQLYKSFVLALFLITFACNTVQIIVDYVLKINISNGFVLTMYKQMCDYFHTCLGSSLFILLKMLLSRLSRTGGVFIRSETSLFGF